MGLFVLRSCCAIVVLLTVAAASLWLVVSVFVSGGFLFVLFRVLCGNMIWRV